MSFAEAPTLSQQYWWSAKIVPLRFVLLKQGKWIAVSLTAVSGDHVHLNDRFVDLTRITSNKTKS